MSMTLRKELEAAKARVDALETLTAAFTAGLIRWERWDDYRGELCFKGLRYALRLDDGGVPMVRPNLIAEIAKASLLSALEASHDR